LAGAAAARNVAYKACRGDILVCMDDDVIPQQDDALESLCRVPKRGLWAATVYDMRPDGTAVLRKHVERGRLILFPMTAVWRKHVYAVGGCDEDFIVPNYEDTWLSMCLKKGRGLRGRFCREVVCHHEWRDRSESAAKIEGSVSSPGSHFLMMRELYSLKVGEGEKTGIWMSSGGAWPYTEGKSFNECAKGAERDRANV
jgi:glycosyltransferase involved in cell wall biosynthesis